MLAAKEARREILQEAAEYSGIGITGYGRWGTWRTAASICGPATGGRSSASCLRNFPIRTIQFSEAMLEMKALLWYDGGVANGARWDGRRALAAMETEGVEGLWMSASASFSSATGTSAGRRWRSLC